MQILSVINFAVAIQGLFLAYLLVNKKAKTLEYRVLALFLVVMSIAILGPVLGLSGYYKEFPHLIRVGDPLVLLFGPLFYYYIYLLSRGKLPPYYYLHLLPFIFYIASLIPFYLLSGQEKIAFAQNLFINRGQQGFVISLLTLRTLHVVAYIIASLFLTQKFKKLLEANYSNTEKRNLDKAAHLLRLYLVLSLITLGVYMFSMVLPINLLVINNLSSLGIGIVIYGLAYSTWNHPAMSEMQLVPLLLPDQSPMQAVDEKQRTTYHLSESQYTALSNRLEELLETEKIYLQSDFSLSELSQRLDILPYLASELINRKYQQSFFDVVNSYRIEEVKNRFNNASFDHYSILGIAMDCGFNSKSSFNTAFKKFTDSTPSQYRQNKPIR
ncbi:MAG TPA: AraC family transcriptional regulator [Daejeonella sp.]|nr:AraC family transcriptional regulator [Daejeonella sp.]